MPRRRDRVPPRLSTNFATREFAPSDGSRIPPAWLNDARDLCTLYLEPLRQEFGPVTIHSGFRTATRNAQVGGAPASYHTKRRGRRGAAADLSCVFGDVRRWYEYLDDLGAPGLGLYDDHLHVDNRVGRARW